MKDLNTIENIEKLYHSAQNGDVLKEKVEVKKVNDKNKCNVLVCTIYECKGLEFDNSMFVKK